MWNRRQYAYHLTSIIALLASLIGAYVTFSKLYSWAALKGVLGSLDKEIFEVALTIFLLVGVLRLVIEALFSTGFLNLVRDALFSKGSPADRKEPSKQ